MNLANLPESLRKLHASAVSAGPNKEFSGHTVQMLIERIAELKQVIEVLGEPYTEEEISVFPWGFPGTVAERFNLLMTARLGKDSPHA